MLKVSVIIPVYNGEQYIDRAIESVLEQTYKSYEIIVINDGSEDSTEQKIQKYIITNKIKYIKQENSGVATARNQGIKIATGDLIAFLDSDDYFLPAKLERQINCFQQNPQLGMVICGWRLVDEKEGVIKDIKIWEYAERLNLKNVILHKPARPSATIITREWCQKINGFDRSLKSGEDLDFILKLILKGCPAIWLKEIQVCYRQHKKSLMSQGKEIVDNTRTVMENFFALPNLPEDIKSLKNREHYQCWLWLACRMYFDGYYGEMRNCLQQSLKYDRSTPQTIVFNWIAKFKNYAKEHSHQLNLNSLINSQYWKQATNSIYPMLENVTSITRSIATFREKILLYTDDLGIGGVRQYNHSIICYLATKGYPITHVCSQKEDPLNIKEKNLGIKQIDLGYHAGNDRTRTLRDIKTAKEIFQQTKPNLIIFSDGWTYSNLAAKQAAIELGIKYIIVLGFIEPSCINFSDDDEFSYRDLATYQYNRAEKVIVVSQENWSLLKKLFKIPESLGRVIHYGRPSVYFTPQDIIVRQRLRQELNISDRGIICFTAARMEPIKGYQYQLSAIRQLKDKPIWSQLYFLWAGTGSESGDNDNEEELKNIVAELGIEDRIKFLGQRWDIPDLLDTSDIFILTSEAEGMPLAIMEAMAKGKPVIATSVSGIPEELGDTGKLLPDPKINSLATINELVSTLENWVSNPELRLKIARECQQRASELFTEERMFAEYYDVIEKVLSIDRNIIEKKDNIDNLLVQKQFKYSCYIWEAWKEYSNNNIERAIEILEKSKTIIPYTPKTQFHWIKRFSSFALENNNKLDIYSLINSPQWKLLSSVL